MPAGARGRHSINEKGLVLTPHCYTVELRFTDSNLNPANISNRLQLVASAESSPIGGPLSTRKRIPFWGYNGKGEIGFQPEWSSLEEGLRFLLGCLHSRKAEILATALEFRAVWWCGHFQASFDGGPTLSAELLTGDRELRHSIFYRQLLL